MDDLPPVCGEPTPERSVLEEEHDYYSPRQDTDDDETTDCEEQEEEPSQQPPKKRKSSKQHTRQPASSRKKPTKKPSNSKKKRRKQPPNSPASPGEPLSQSVHSNKELRRIYSTGTSSPSTSTTESTCYSHSSSSNMPATRKRGGGGKSSNTKNPKQARTATSTTTKTIKEHKEYIKELTDEKAQLDDENNKLYKELDDLNEKIRQLEGTQSLTKMVIVRGGGGKKATQKQPGYSKGHANTMERTVKHKVFRRIKFIQNEKQERQLAEWAFDASGLANEEPFLQPNTPEGRARFEELKEACVIRYMPVCREALNNHRSYIQQQLKNKMWEWRAKTKKPFPTVDQIIEVATRNLPPLGEDPSPEDQNAYDEVMAIAILYWDVLLPAVAGNAWWRWGIRSTTTISKAQVGGDACITAGTEAMAVLCYENCLDKWNEIWELQKKDPKAKIPKKKNDSESQKFRGLFSNPFAGQAKYGGWNRKGIARFKELRTLISEARGDEENCEEWEQKVLVAVRVDHDLSEEVNDKAGDDNEDEDEEEESDVELEFDD